MTRYKITEYKDGDPTTERVIEGEPKDVLEVFSALITGLATTTTRAATCIADAEKSLPQLPIGAGITAIPNGTHCITIHRLVEGIKNSPVPAQWRNSAMGTRP